MRYSEVERQLGQLFDAEGNPSGGGSTAGAMFFAGTWDDETAYAEGAVVKHEGTLYVARSAREVADPDPTVAGPPSPDADPIASFPRFRAGSTDRPIDYFISYADSVVQGTTVGKSSVPTYSGSALVAIVGVHGLTAGGLKLTVTNGFVVGTYLYKGETDPADYVTNDNSGVVLSGIDTPGDRMFYLVQKSSPDVFTLTLSESGFPPEAELSTGGTIDLWTSLI